MLIKLSTDKTVSEAAAALQAAPQANDFRFMQVRLESNVRDEGEDAGNDERDVQATDG